MHLGKSNVDAHENQEKADSSVGFCAHGRGREGGRATINLCPELLGHGVRSGHARKVLSAPRVDAAGANSLYINQTSTRPHALLSTSMSSQSTLQSTSWASRPPQNNPLYQLLHPRPQQHTQSENGKSYGSSSQPPLRSDSPRRRGRGSARNAAPSTGSTVAAPPLVSEVVHLTIQRVVHQVGGAVQRERPKTNAFFFNTKTYENKRRQTILQSHRANNAPDDNARTAPA